MSDIVKVGGAEYDALKRFLSTAAVAVFGAPASSPTTSPLVHLARMEQGRPALAAKGLRMAVADLLSELTCWNSDRLRSLEKELGAAGAHSVAQVRALMSAEVRDVLKRRRIVSEDECLVAKALIEGNVLGGAMQALLRKCVQEFERI